MSSSPASDPHDLYTGILQYLCDHPEAADSLEGIAAWWLSPAAYSVTLEATQAALALLVADRRIARIDLADGRTLYQSVDKISGSHAAWKPSNP